MLICPSRQLRYTIGGYHQKKSISFLSHSITVSKNKVGDFFGISGTFWLWPLFGCKNFGDLWRRVQKNHIGNFFSPGNYSLGGPLRASDSFFNSKNYAKQGCHVFSEKNVWRYREKTVREPFCVSERFWYRKTCAKEISIVQIFFCLTVRKTFVEGTT